MATTHKIFDDFYEETFSLFALHCSLEDHAVVYALNEALKTKLQRSDTDLEMLENFSFPLFEWKDELNHRNWTLITNYCSRQDKSELEDLFQNETSFSTHHLIPEYKEVDYFLKIEHDEDMNDTLLKSVLKMPKIIAAYPIDIDTLKSKNNLIF